MDPQAQSCHNPDCPARGQTGLGSIHVHSRQERRYRCMTCGRTFAATSGTLFYRFKMATDLVTIVLTSLGHGCPPQKRSSPPSASMSGPPPRGGTEPAGMANASMPTWSSGGR